MFVEVAILPPFVLVIAFLKESVNASLWLGPEDYKGCQSCKKKKKDKAMLTYEDLLAVFILQGIPITAKADKQCC